MCLAGSALQHGTILVRPHVDETQPGQNHTTRHPLPEHPGGKPCSRCTRYPDRPRVPSQRAPSQHDLQHLALFLVRSNLGAHGVEDRSDASANAQQRAWRRRTPPWHSMSLLHRFGRVIEDVAWLTRVPLTGGMCFSMETYFSSPALSDLRPPISAAGLQSPGPGRMRSHISHLPSHAKIWSWTSRSRADPVGGARTNSFSCPQMRISVTDLFQLPAPTTAGGSESHLKSTISLRLGSRHQIGVFPSRIVEKC